MHSSLLQNICRYEDLSLYFTFTTYLRIQVKSFHYHEILETRTSQTHQA
jgi:hypothetical protein